ALAPVRSDLARGQRRVILASSLGTLFEWYDFYLYGSLSGVISRQFFSAVNETTGFIFALLAFGAGAFVRPLGALVFGGLSDRIGRKPLVLGGCLLAVLTFFPLFHGLTHYANPALQKAMAAAPVTVIAPPGECSFQFDPIGNSSFTNSCD